MRKRPSHQPRDTDPEQKRSVRARTAQVVGATTCAVIIAAACAWGVLNSVAPRAMSGILPPTTAPVSAPGPTQASPSPTSSEHPEPGQPSQSQHSQSLPQSGPTPTRSTVPSSSAASAEEEQSASFYVLTAGDVLLHTPVHESAKKGRGYEFSPLMKHLDASVDAAALSLCHMEVPLVPKDNQVSGYPAFGASSHIAQDLSEAGWDGCSTASNHSLDRGTSGISTTIDALTSAGLGFTGTARSKKESQEIQFYTVKQNGFTIDIAHLSATRALNGARIPSETPWLVNVIDPENLIEQARMARTLGADIVIVSAHDGVEYEFQPDQQQRDLAQSLADSGLVDLYVGHHPHVPQPITLLKGGPQGTGMWTAYSHGNFLSNQDTPCCGPLTSTGLLMYTHIEASAGKAPHVSQVRWRGVTVDRSGGHMMYDLTSLNRFGKSVGNLSSETIKTRHQQLKKALGSEAKELKKLPKFEGSVTARRETIPPS